MFVICDFCFAIENRY